MPMFRILVIVLAVLVLAPPARAAATAAKLSAADLADIGRIERALNDVRTLQAKFLQIADNGGKASGTFSMSRPGRMRLVYDPPIKDFIVSDGWFVFYWDAELQQQSSQPIGASLADFFLRETIKLSGDVTVTKLAHQAGTVEVSIVQTDDAGKGELTLVFEDKPLRLHSWRVVDAQGLTTVVLLSEVKTGVKFADDTFLFIDPNMGKPKRR